MALPNPIAHALSQAAYGKRRRQDLAAPLPYPWRERAKPLEGRAVKAHVGVRVLLCARVQLPLATLLVKK